MSSKTCPICNGPMVSRRRKRDQHPFYGCKSYPKCNGTSPIQDPSPSDWEIVEYEDYIKDVGDR